MLAIFVMARDLDGEFRHLVDICNSLLVPDGSLTTFCRNLTDSRITDNVPVGLVYDRLW